MSGQGSARRELVLLTGVSGSGKSVALAAMEDAGHYCVDNLPPRLLIELLDAREGQPDVPLAVSVDARSGDQLADLPKRLQTLRQRGVAVQVVFLEASTEALLRRFSETRRLHPLSRHQPTPHATPARLALLEAIDAERTLMQGMRDAALVLDTSNLTAAQLRAQIQSLLHLVDDSMALLFESFAYRRGVPLDADLVFDMRMLPNPFYEPALRALCGLDAPVADYLKAQPEVADMVQDITHYLQRWLPAMQANQRSYVTVAIGCTGGQHRSVYVAQQLARRLGDQWPTHVRHRELPGTAPASPATNA